MTDKQTEALERLNQGIQESRQEVQKRTMNLAQGYFDDSAEALKQQIKENRATLENLPDQVPGGREEAFQSMFQELMDNYSAMEERIDEARDTVANLDTDKIRRQGEIEATDAARREADERGVDLTQVEGTGSDGRIIVSDVVEAAEALEDGEEGAAGEAAQEAQQQAEQAVQGAQDTAGQAADQAGQVAGQVQEAAGGAAQQAQDTAGQAADQAGQIAGQATGQAGQAAGQVQGTVDGLTGDGQEDGGGPLGGVTDQVGQVAGQAQDAAGGAVQQAQGTAGQATDQAGQAAQGVRDAAGGATQQAQETVGYAAEQAQDTAGQATGAADGSKATNAARRKAEKLGIDLSTVEGTGSGGLITIQDVEDS